MRDDGEQNIDRLIEEWMDGCKSVVVRYANAKVETETNEPDVTRRESVKERNEL
ncbi:hypothetical protein BS17DRAFT_788284 [Gyrodon lividus]|nr:hypothetical protein BS17DRAFT_788284 [Gyrodon lividus]